MLYIALGDGGAGNDPHENAQNMGTWLGKILRIDVDHHDMGKAYAVPKDNPFVGQDGVLPEIYSSGWRNPWRIAVDSKTGDLWGADVGQNLYEEINIITKGGNYGWNRLEATHPFGNKAATGETVAPVWEYDHMTGKSITGGTVYRGSAVPALAGKYVYADYVSGKVWALTYDAAAKKATANETIEGNNLPILSFGEDEKGELYFLVVAADGHGIYRLRGSRLRCCRGTGPSGPSRFAALINQERHGVSCEYVSLGQCAPGPIIPSVRRPSSPHPPTQSLPQNPAFGGDEVEHHTFFFCFEVLDPDSENAQREFHLGVLGAGFQPMSRHSSKLRGKGSHFHCMKTLQNTVPSRISAHPQENTSSDCTR